MTYRQTMTKLKAMGTAQNRKVYGRHGVSGEMFGVSYANLGKLEKEVKVDHDLALQLWDSGNHDARVLASMIVDRARLDSKTLEAWLADCDDYVVTGAVTTATYGSPLSERKMKKWMKSNKEWTGRAGWSLLARLATDDLDLPDGYFAPYLDVAEQDIHRRKNRVRDAMNSALIAIGLRSDALEKKAIAAAKRIGTVEVDHGETGCKTPDAVAYIKHAKARARARRKRPAKRVRA